MPAPWRDMPYMNLLFLESYRKEDGTWSCRDVRDQWTLWCHKWHDIGVMWYYEGWPNYGVRENSIIVAHKIVLSSSSKLSCDLIAYGELVIEDEDGTEHPPTMEELSRICNGFRIEVRR